MSCSVKISCGKGWGGSQRRIGSLAEEASACPPGPAVNCAGLQAVQPSATSTSGSTSTTNNTTATATVTVAFNNPVVITTSSTSTVAIAAAAAGTTTTASVNIAAGNQRVVPPRPVKSIAAKKGEDTTKLLKYIDDNVIGKNGTFFGPFGRRKGQ